MKIGLLGFTFAHENMGCQALTCSFLGLLSDIVKDEEISVVDFHEEKTLGLMPELFPGIKMENFHISLKKNAKEFIKKVKECDIVFDESYGDGFSDIYFTRSVVKHTLVKIIVSKSGVPIVLTPQTYGPFKKQWISKMAGLAIHNAKTVYARDSLSAAFAEKIGHRKVRCTTDLAFCLKYEQQEKIPNSVGINVSGLLWNGGFNGKENQFGLTVDYREYIKKVIEHALDRGKTVYLIPHVTKTFVQDRNIPDSDYLVCEELAALYPDVRIAPLFETPMQAKEFISSMCLFTGARMHATIAAFSSGTVTIPFAYSRKFQGVYEDLDYPYYVDGTALTTEEAIKRTNDVIDDPEECRKVLEKSQAKVAKLTGRFKKELSTLLKCR